MGSLFVSHSSNDNREVARLCDWLLAEGFRSLFVDFDPKRGFVAGVKWEAELYAQLRRADAVLFVGSAASVASQWCFAELAMARSLGKTIIPAIVGVGGSHPLLVDTQTVDLTDADEQKFERLRHRLSMAELDPERTFEWDPARSPFPGLKSFDERDAAVFFGRQAETELLLAQMRSSRRRYLGRLIAVVGPSGSGKSSLVRAGLLPRLRRMQPPWVVLSVLRPGDRPLRQLALALVDAFRDAGVPRSLQSVELGLDKGDAGLVALAEQLSDHEPGNPKPAVLVFVDQAEELVAQAAGEEHARFLALLHGATRGPAAVWSLLTLRSEFLSVFLRAELGETTFDDQLLVGPLEGARLAEVIERPADRAGVSFEPGLVGRMVTDTGGGDALPLLAHTLAALHERVRMRGSRTITIGDYEDLGGVVGALRRSADEEHRHLSERGFGDLVLPALNKLVTVGPEDQPTRRRLARSAFSEQEDQVVEAFIEARLLTSTELDMESVVEVAHEALLRQWPPLADAIERDREMLHLRSALEREAKDWQRSGRRDEYLLPGARLLIANRLNGSAEGVTADLTQLEGEFLAASQERQRLEEAVKRRRTQRTLSGLAGALLIVSGLAIAALVLGHRASDQRDAAQATLLATNALGELPTDPGESLVFAMQAYATKRTALTEGALRVAASQATPQVVLRGHDGPVSGLAQASDGRHVAIARQDGTVRVWDWRSPRTAPILLRTHGVSFVQAAAFAPDGEHVAAAGEGGVRVWDWRSPRTAPTILRNQYGATAVAFAGDGRHVAATPEDGTVRVWDWRSPRMSPITLRGNRFILNAVAFGGDGRHLASAGGQRARVWDWRSPGTAPARLGSGGALGVAGVAFASDGRHLATAGADGKVLVWDRRLPHKPLTVLRGHQGSVSTVAFDADGRLLVSGGDDGTVRVWNWRSPHHLIVVLRGHQGPVTGVAFTGDGRHITSAGADGTVRVWDWRLPPSPYIAVRFHQPISGQGAFTLDGRHFAGVQRDGTVRVWDVRSPHIARTVLHSPKRPISTLTFAPDGRYLATAGTGGIVRVWNWRSPRLTPILLRARESSVDSMAFTPDGRYLATAAGDGTVRIWDWRSPRIAPVVLHRHAGLSFELRFTPDGRHLAIAGEGLQVWDWHASHTSPAVLRSRDVTVWSVAFTADGRYLASADDSGIRVWDWQSQARRPSVIGDQQSPVRLAFAADGRHLASSDRDGVRVWDWRLPRTPPTFLHLRFVTSMAFVADGRRLVSAARDGKQVRVWECQRCGNIKDVLEIARARRPREFGRG